MSQELGRAKAQVPLADTMSAVAGRAKQLGQKSVVHAQANRLTRQYRAALRKQSASDVRENGSVTSQEASQ